MRHILPTSTSRDEAERSSSIAVLPVGSFEQHGDHLPLATDALIACLIAAEVADAYQLMSLPPITITCSHEHASWPGTVSISARTLNAVINDIADSLRTSGVGGLLIVNGHGGNYVLSNVVQEASVQGPVMALFPSRDDWRDSRAAAGMQSDSHLDMHAGELETSLMLHAYPELVRAGFETGDHEANDRRSLLSLGLRAYTSSGVIGAPSLASADKGKALLTALVEIARTHVDLLRSVANTPADADSLGSGRHLD